MLLNTRKYRENASKRYDAFYGRSWLLFHYLMLSGKRPGQLGDYLEAAEQRAKAKMPPQPVRLAIWPCWTRSWSAT